MRDHIRQIDDSIGDYYRRCAKQAAEARKALAELECPECHGSGTVPVPGLPGERRHCEGLDCYAGRREGVSYERWLAARNALDQARDTGD